jgi:hypothetical protein
LSVPNNLLNMPWREREESDEEPISVKSADALRNEIMEVGQLMAKHGDDYLEKHVAGDESKAGLALMLKERIKTQSNAISKKLCGENSPRELKAIQKEVAGIRAVVLDIIYGRTSIAANE